MSGFGYFLFLWKGNLEKIWRDMFLFLTQSNTWIKVRCNHLCKNLFVLNFKSSIQALLDSNVSLLQNSTSPHVVPRDDSWDQDAFYFFFDFQCAFPSKRKILSQLLTGETISKTSSNRIQEKKSFAIRWKKCQLKRPIVVCFWQRLFWESKRVVSSKVFVIFHEMVYPERLPSSKKLNHVCELRVERQWPIF